MLLLYPRALAVNIRTPPSKLIILAILKQLQDSENSAAALS